MSGNQYVPTREELREALYTLPQYERRIERVTLRDAARRILAADACARWTLPNTPLSAMDGIAVFFDRVKDRPDTSNWVQGVDWQYANTGSALPEPFDTVILIEQVDFSDGLRILWYPQAKGENVNPVGSMLHEGEVLVEAGRALTPALLGLLAAGGVEEVDVIAKPRVAVIPTGSELQAAGEALQKGKNIETTSIVVAEYLRELGAEPIVYPIAHDSEELIGDALLDALARADIVITIGGTSKGNCDLSVKTMGTFSDMVCNQVAHGPAKRTSFALAHGKPILGLVGPAVSAEMTIGFYVEPLIDGYYKRPLAQFESVQARLTCAAACPTPFDFFAQTIIEQEPNGTWSATPLLGENLKGSQMSSNAMGLTVVPHDHSTRVEMSALAGGYLRLHKGDSYQAGDSVTIELKR